MKIGIGVSIPLLILLAVIGFAIHYFRRSCKAKKELDQFDRKIKAMYTNNRRDDVEEKGNKMVYLTIDRQDKKSTISNSTTSSDTLKNRPLRYVFETDKKSKSVC